MRPISVPRSPSASKQVGYCRMLHHLRSSSRPRSVCPIFQTSERQTASSGVYSFPNCGAATSTLPILRNLARRKRGSSCCSLAPNREREMDGFRGVLVALGTRACSIMSKSWRGFPPNIPLYRVRTAWPMLAALAPVPIVRPRASASTLKLLLRTLVCAAIQLTLCHVCSHPLLIHI